MPRDWLNNGSDRAFAESVITEAIRRVKLEARNDAAFVPPGNDVSLILAARAHAVPPPPNERPVDEVSLVLASRAYNRGATADASVATTATSTNTPSTIVARDANGDFAARDITARALTLSGNVVIGSGTGLTLYSTIGQILYENDNNSKSWVVGAGGAVHDQTFIFYDNTAGVTRGLINNTGGLQWNGRFSCNGAAPLAAQTSGGTLAGVIAGLVAIGLFSS